MPTSSSHGKPGPDVLHPPSSPPLLFFLGLGGAAPTSNAADVVDVRVLDWSVNVS
jgi:hypothetical protein